MRLACITIPNFRIALERLRDASLRGRPFAIGEPPPGANTIVECSPEAAALGVRAGMPLRDARTLAPDLSLLPPDPVYYSRSYDALLLALEDAEPLIEPADDGTAFSAIDPNADEKAEWDAASRLVRAVKDAAGIDASVGIGEGKFIAWVAAAVSAPGEATTVPAGREQAFVAPLSTSFLPISFESQRKLGLYGLHKIGDVAELTVGPLQAQFGREGRRLWQLAHGIDLAPFRPRERHEPVAGSIAMPAPTVNTGALIIAARQLIGRLLQHPRMRYRQVRQFRLRLALLDGGSWERAVTFREPLGDEESMAYVVKKLIEPVQLAGPVEEMMLEFVELTGELGKQRSLLFVEQARRRAQLIGALRQLKTRFGGDSQVARVVEVEPWSRIPERRYALIDYDL
ncbi:MAG: DNA polymerase Y family protein [Dehalococcoidia bacterium]